MSGEDHAVAEFKAASQSDLPAEVRSLVDRQYADIKQSHDTVRALRDQYSKR